MKTSLIHSFSILVVILIISFFCSVPLLALFGLLLLYIPINIMEVLGLTFNTAASSGGPLGDTPLQAFIISAGLWVCLVVVLEIIVYFSNKKRSLLPQ